MIYEKDVRKLGFKRIDAYAHDEFFTKEYRKGPLGIDFTYEGSDLAHVTTRIDEVDFLTLTDQEFKDLVRILWDK
jgi:hypothetical protein